MDAAYRARLFDQRLYENRTFVGVQIRPERYAGEFIGDQIAIRQRPVEQASEERLQRLEDVVALLMAELKPYRPRRLALRVPGRVVFSEMAEALVLAMTGIWRPIGLTTGRLGEAMFSEQIVIDREFIKYLLPGRVWYGAMFGMKHFPAWTCPGMYGQLLASSYLSTTCQSFRFVPTNTAQDIMRRKRSRMLTAEDPAEAQAEALRSAANGLGSADYVLGDYAFSLLTFAASPKALTDVATAAWADLADSGMVVSREMLGLEAAFFSMVPGNARLRPRPGYITSANFAAMAPLHAYPIGSERRPLGSADRDPPLARGDAHPVPSACRRRRQCAGDGRDRQRQEPDHRLPDRHGVRARPGDRAGPQAWLGTADPLDERPIRGARRRAAQLRAAQGAGAHGSEPGVPHRPATRLHPDGGAGPS